EHYRVIPNPSSGQFVLSMNSIAERTRLDIFNSMGQLVVTKEYIDKQYLEFEILQPSGIYFAQILSSDNLPGYIRLVKQ
ncbi:MAG: T9SS type A sorting domain-containing protein, partial [Flavobacteriales bacterium]|nr:T9SS type A sorting domain-containing protein [Flavobacteriales bacterium]